MVFGMMWVNHMASCMWYAAGRYFPSDTGLCWLDADIMGPESGKYDTASLSYQYFTAFHWSLTQMTPGSMQVFPVNSGERVFNIFVLMGGFLFFSVVVSAISTSA